MTSTGVNAPHRPGCSQAHPAYPAPHPAHLAYQACLALSRYSSNDGPGRRRPANPASGR